MVHAWLCLCVCGAGDFIICVHKCLHMFWVSPYLPPLDIFGRKRVMHWNVIRYFLHEPLETFASMFLPEKKVQILSSCYFYLQNNIHEKKTGKRLFLLTINEKVTIFSDLTQNPSIHFLNPLYHLYGFTGLPQHNLATVGRKPSASWESRQPVTEPHSHKPIHTHSQT